MARTGEPGRRRGASPLEVRIEGRIARLTLQRPAKRNALSDRLIAALGRFFASPPDAMSGHLGTVPAAGGRRGTFTGGGASVRVGRLIGADRLVEVAEIFLRCCLKALIRTRLSNEDALKNGLFL